MNANLISNLAGLGNVAPQYLTVSIAQFTRYSPNLSTKNVWTMRQVKIFAVFTRNK